MRDQPYRVRRVEATDPITATGLHDYADAFEVRLPEPDPQPPETWVRAGLEDVPRTVQRIARLLGIRDAPRSPDRVDVFRIVESGPELVHLEATLPLMRVVLVGRTVEPTLRRLTTVLRYRRPTVARLVWAAVGPLHRRMAVRLITSEITTNDRSGDAEAGHAAT